MMPQLERSGGISKDADIAVKRAGDVHTQSASAPISMHGDETVTPFSLYHHHDGFFVIAKVRRSLRNSVVF